MEEIESVWVGDELRVNERDGENTDLFLGLALKQQWKLELEDTGGRE